jgi:hypothetical protein
MAMMACFSGTNPVDFLQDEPPKKRKKRRVKGMKCFVEYFE